MAQVVLRREFPSLYVTGEWDYRSQHAFDSASHDVRVEVIKAVADAGHSLNEIQSESGKGVQNVKATITSTLDKAANAVSRGVRDVIRQLGGAEQRFYTIAATRGLTPESALHLMVQVRAESNFTPKREDHRYSVSRARAIFSALRGVSDGLIRQAVAGGPEVFFELTYGHTTVIGKTLGNTTKGDGGRYFGRGLLQITGRDNYTRCGNALGVDLLSNPDLLVLDWDVSAAAAVWFWKERVEARDAEMNVSSATRIVTGSLHDVDRRIGYSREYFKTTA